MTELTPSEKEDIRDKCPLKKDGCCGTIVALCDLCEEAFDKDRLEELLRIKTGEDFVLEIRKQEVA